ncbi:Localization factor PodJL (Polar organelle development protein) [Cleaved into: Localization factor PodJS] [Durusdinium trenchii]|uniref:Localization factor PodJL (Polar organelle development protein) [Cleaved into: Localization factor PodJS] n=1 Tax=Durusdinium trenchii TaxID=1381693 RepID=A0ABP0LK01_9DINO
MKSSAPWSVKGIERDARETAKEAAKREGMTVGEWLNQIIYTAGSGEETEGEIEGLKLRDLVTAVEHLNKRIGEAEAKNADSLGDLSRNIGGVVERIQRLERVKPTEGSNADITARVEKLEQSGGDLQRIEALKALEKAVAQVAAQFSNTHKTSIERLDANEREIQTLAERIDTVGVGEQDAGGASFLKGAINELSERVSQAEHIAAEAAALKADASGSVDPDFVERTGERLRVLGDEIKRGGDQIRSLESTISKLSAQIDDAERRSAEGVQKVTDTIAEMREQFSGASERGVTRAEIDAAITAANQDAEEDIAALQNRIDSIVGRIDGEKEQPVSEEAMPVQNDGDIVHGAGEPVSDDTGSLDGFTAGETSSTSEAKNTDDVAAQPDEDIDPFSFADEIDAAIEEQSDSSDDFAFDIDDDDASSGAKALLEEVQDVFGKRDDASSSSDDEDSDKDDTAHAQSEIAAQQAEFLNAEDDLDAILSDIGGDETQSSALSKPAEPQTTDDDRKAARAMLFGEPPAEEASRTETTSDESSANEDFLQTARRRAREAAQETASAKGTTRRKLTPKQRAILAARARQKRLAAASSENAPNEAENKQPQKPQAPSDAETATAPQRNETEASADSDERSSTVEKMMSAASAFRNKLPLIGKATEKEEQHATIESASPQPEEENIDGSSAALATLKSTFAARPVTIALGVAIFLAVGALFYLVQDLVFKSPPTNNSRPAATTPSVSNPETTDASTADSAQTSTASDIADGAVIDPRALYLDAVAALNSANGGDETNAAIATLEESAALGHPPAQLQLGELYKTGQGVDQDLGQARTWFRRAANGGNVLAMHRIGVMTARGDGGPADTAEAVGWFERAANRGLVDSQYNLGAIYHPSDTAGASSIQDAGKSYFWYSLASKNGDEQATPLAAGVAGALSADELNTIDAQIAAWQVQPADDEANEMASIN